MGIVTLNDIKKKEADKKNKKSPSEKKNQSTVKTSYRDIFNSKSSADKKGYADNSSNKLETKRRQTVDKLGSEPETKCIQTVDKVETRKNPKDETVDKVETKLETQPETKRRQTVDKVETNESFSSLVGNQRNIVNFIYKQCRQNASLVTNSITLEHISVSCEIPMNSLKKTIQRLKNKGTIIRDSYKNGRGGWTKYKLPQNIYTELLNLESVDKLETNRRQSVDKLETEPETKLETGYSSSSSNLNKNINSTTTETFMPNDWKEIEIPDFLFKKGFTKNVITQIFSAQKKHKGEIPELTADDVQTSLNHYAYDLENKLTYPVKSALIQFIGTVKVKGEAWISPTLIEKEEAALKELKAANEKRKLLRKQKEDVFYETKALDLMESLSKEIKIEILKPKADPFGYDSFAYNKQLEGEIIKILKEKGVDYFEGKNNDILNEIRDLNF